MPEAVAKRPENPLALSRRQWETGPVPGPPPEPSPHIEEEQFSPACFFTPDRLLPPLRPIAPHGNAPPFAEIAFTR